LGIIKLPQASINFFKSNLDEIFETGNLAEGAWNKRLSDFARKYCEVECATPIVSNGSGLMALLQIYKENDNRFKVFLQSNTMYGVKTLVNSAGLEVCGYIDCNPMTLMPDFSDVENAVKDVADKQSLVILLSHIGGIINSEIVEIAEFCKQNNVVLLEDCAHSFGATYKNKHSGTFGDAGVYSFYATKAIPAGEGGIAVTNNKSVGAILDKYVMYDRFNQEMNIGVNIRPSEVQALLIYSVAKEVDQIIKNKNEIASKYIAVCEELSIPFLRQDLEDNIGNYYKFIVLSKQGDISVDLPNLKTTTSKVYDYCLGNTKVITTNHACLPIWYGQSPDVTEKVIRELKESVK
jgi:dTDP-4-amino-4,6-dideoxygalactose transaminase